MLTALYLAGSTHETKPTNNQLYNANLTQDQTINPVRLLVLNIY